MIRVRRAKPEEVIDLRHRVLRAGLARETAIFVGDDAPGTVHVVAVDESPEGGERVVGCATMMLSPWQDQPQDQPAWQVRGMAVAPSRQRSGVGSLMLRELQCIARDDTADGPRLMWCNARSPAVAFYQRHGWVVASEEFLIASAGPHHKMMFKLPPPDVR